MNLVKAIARAAREKPTLVVFGSLAAIAASGLWIYQYRFASSGVAVPLHQAVGHVLAEETSRRVGHVGQIVIVTMDTHNAPELKVQVKAFEKSLKLLGAITIQDKVMLDPGDNPKYRPGSGLSAKRFLKIARKHPGVDAIVSFVGVPQLSDAELAQLKTPPKVVAETHSPERLLNLFEKKILQAAVVPRYEFPAPGPRKPETSRQWFDRYFQVVLADTPLPSDDATP
jgi:hypothetical protein